MSQLRNMYHELYEQASELVDAILEQQTIGESHDPTAKDISWKTLIERIPEQQIEKLFDSMIKAVQDIDYYHQP